MNLVIEYARSTVAVIDTVVQRGGFKGEELSTIGQLRDQAVQIIQICEEYQSAQGLTINLLTNYLIYSIIGIYRKEHK